MSKARISIGESERQLGLFFVAISRVRCLEDLALERPINADRLASARAAEALPDLHRHRAIMAINKRIAIMTGAVGDD